MLCSISVFFVVQSYTNKEAFYDLLLLFVQISEVSGLIVLDQCNIAATATNRKFSFTIGILFCL